MLSVLNSFGQYPTVPQSVVDSTNAAQAELKKASSKAWQKALVTVKEEAKNGRPYILDAKKPEDLPQSKIAAFPGAEGGGAYTAGGRGGKVIVVTNLNDSGPGSFRAACEEGGARIVLFNVAGIIRLKSDLSIKAPYITIAGQSAPGDGVCIAGATVSIDTHDVIVRFMRFRRGETNVAERDDSFGGNPVGNIIIDHVSASWGLDENMSMYRHIYNGQKLPTVNITIQNSIFSEALDTYNHAFGSTIGGLNSTFMRNLWASNVARNPSVGMYGDFGFVNNVVFNWWNRSADGGDNASFFSFINNYYKPGPITPVNEPIAYRILKPEAGREKQFAHLFGRAYVTGNIVEGNERVTKNNWDGGVQPADQTNNQKLLDSIKSDQSFLTAKLSLLSAKKAYDYVLENAGASLPKRDAVDLRIIEQVRTGKVKYSENAKPPVGGAYIKRRLPIDSYKQGIISDISQVGGYPEYSGTPYKDSDLDGMPDEYEIKNGLNPKDASDASKYKGNNSYTNIENYLNGLVDVKKVAPRLSK